MSATTNNLTGLILTRNERLLLIALSYLYTAPYFYKKAIQLYTYIRLPSHQARREYRQQQQQQQQRRGA